MTGRLSSSAPAEHVHVMFMFMFMLQAGCSRGPQAGCRGPQARQQRTAERLVWPTAAHAAQLAAAVQHVE
jgi:hypothetical protein